MAKTKIEWADRSWNPVTGCEKVSAGCAHCYAEGIAKRFWKDRKFTDVRIHPERLREPLHWRKPQRIFVNSMSDLFHERVYDNDESFIDEIFAVAAACPQHTFMILTKRSGIMRNYFNHPRRTMYVESALEWLFEGRLHMMPELVWPLPNVWLGVSVEDQRAAEERISDLLETPAAVRFVSCEPLLGPLDLWSAQFNNQYGGLIGGVTNWPGGLDWVIVGGESGPKARPMHPDWVRGIRDQCLAGNVPFFFKQWGEWVLKGSTEDQRCSDFGVLDPAGVFYRGHTGWNGRPIDPDTNEAYMLKVGKKKAGRVLDGREWNEFPTSEGGE